jgi:hypothetical protein
VPEFVDPVLPKTSLKRSFSVIQNDRFGLVFAKTVSVISGTCNKGTIRRFLFGLDNSFGSHPSWPQPVAADSFTANHRLINMELNLQSLFGLHVHILYTGVLIDGDPAPPPPAFGLIYTRALLVSHDRRHLFVTH